MTPSLEDRDNDHQRKRHRKSKGRSRERSRSRSRGKRRDKSNEKSRDRKRRHHERSNSPSNDRKRHRSHKSERSDRKKDGREHKHRKRSRSRSRSRGRDKERGEKTSKRRQHKEDGKTGKSSSADDFRSKASPVDRTKLIPLGGGQLAHEPTKDQQLDSERDYFSHNSHLRLYLYRTYGIYFEDLTSDQSREAFKEFVQRYNEGVLEEPYYAYFSSKDSKDSNANYDGKELFEQALEQCNRTKHVWKFRTNKMEERSLEVVRAGVKKQTEYDEDGTAKEMSLARDARAASSLVQSANAPLGHTNGDNINDRHDEIYNKRSSLEKRLSDKRHRERLKLAEEEMNPRGGKPDHGWERNREKRQQRSEAIHGAARDREGEAWGGAELDDDAIYGGSGVGRKRGGDISYEEAVAKERHYRMKRETEQSARRSELLKKEEEKQANMFKMLGLAGVKPGQKITIAPRKDNS